jgi:predicted nucleotidyltransferase
VFGSVARGTSADAGGVDLLADFEASRTLIGQARLRRDLQPHLERQVDVVSARGPIDRDDDIRADALTL